ncbi:Fe-only nitrogenase accessory AnfO family protein [Propionibacterium sp.]|uniref:Fe-only nitrogenase accessory AnfO family protein n=1 Tax=Propionibacterium sp. TaxID=1977903 RepID=UPI0039E80373
MKIAMFLDSAGRATSPEFDGTIYVYEREANEWIVDRSMEFPAVNCSTLPAMRARVELMCDWLQDDCQILAVMPPRGFSGGVFTRNNVDLWIVDGTPDNDLDVIEKCCMEEAPVSRVLYRRGPVTAS